MKANERLTKEEMHAERMAVLFAILEEVRLLRSELQAERDAERNGGEGGPEGKD